MSYTFNSHYPNRCRVTVDGYEFRSDFDSGNCARVDRLGANSYGIWTAPDCVGTPNETPCRTWFYFSVNSVSQGETLTFCVKNINNQSKMLRDGLRPVYRSSPSMSDFERLPIPVTSWKACDGGLEMVFKHTFTTESEEVFFAFCWPWSLDDNEKMLAEVMDKYKHDNEIYINRETLVLSKDKRPCELITLTSREGMEKGRERHFHKELFPHKEVEERPRNFGDRPSVVLSARVHPGETPASFLMNGAIKFLLNKTDPRAIELRRNFVFYLVPMLNPDGVSRGYYRSDTNGMNLNRYYQSPAIEVQPTIFAVKELLLYLKAEKGLQVYIDLHAHASKRGGFIFGNCLDYPHQVDNVLFSKLVSMNSVNFDFAACSYSEKNMRARDKREGMTKEGCGRVAIYKATNLVHSYTLECNYHSGLRLSPLYPISRDDYNDYITKEGLKNEYPKENGNPFSSSEGTTNEDLFEESTQSSSGEEGRIATSHTCATSTKGSNNCNKENETERDRSDDKDEEEEEDDEEDEGEGSKACLEDQFFKPAMTDPNKMKGNFLPETDLSNYKSSFYKKGTPPYDPQVLEDIGKGMCIAILDLADLNPMSRIKNSPFRNLSNLRIHVSEKLLAHVPYRFDPLFRKITKELNRFRLAHIIDEKPVLKPSNTSKTTRKMPPAIQNGQNKTVIDQVSYLKEIRNLIHKVLSENSHMLTDEQRTLILNPNPEVKDYCTTSNKTYTYKPYEEKNKSKNGSGTSSRKFTSSVASKLHAKVQSKVALYRKQRSGVSSGGTTPKSAGVGVKDRLPSAIDNLVGGGDRSQVLSEPSVLDDSIGGGGGGAGSNVGTTGAKRLIKTRTIHLREQQANVRIRHYERKSQSVEYEHFKLDKRAGSAERMRTRGVLEPSPLYRLDPVDSMVNKESSTSATQLEVNRNREAKLKNRGRVYHSQNRLQNSRSVSETSSRRGSQSGGMVSMTCKRGQAIMPTLMSFASSNNGNGTPALGDAPLDVITERSKKQKFLKRGRSRMSNNLRA
eukprot:CAMPEP_0115022640 /NCGR_PEP_ID=MMETSP0216-20121206/31702_1 /TAXON_ID=223996 /ORGANISM="Protocruzia adherens, Strain Boccale" /LENGTH=1017 /DNA_ID=CAMNT_0002395425 /DNA_START=142 /DNA_END=3195 /DNA_ORIENTATION=-